jgi:hypothetical protein
MSGDIDAVDVVVDVLGLMRVEETVPPETLVAVVAVVADPALPVVFWFRVGTSVAAIPRNVGVPADPLGAARNVLAVWLAKLDGVTDNVPPKVKLPLDVTVPDRVMPLTVPVPPTLVTVPAPLPLKVLQSVEVKYPFALALAAAMLIIGAVPPVDATGEVAVTLVTVPLPLPLKVFQSVEVKYPLTLVVAAGMLMSGAVPPLDATGAVAVTLVTVPVLGV